jgi:hypothetical protein
MTRANYLPSPHYFNLNHAVKVIDEAFDGNVGIYLVGSSLHKRDYRDVDVRLILRDEAYERLFGPKETTEHYVALWSLMCSSIALWLSQQTELPIDFQIQCMSRANEMYPSKEHKRAALGVFLHYPGAQDA